jgi:TP901 family phage tail tape measure protein
MNYRDIVVRLGVAGVSSFVGQLNLAAGAVEAMDKKIIASARELAANANVNMARLADARYGPVARGGERAVSVMRAQAYHATQIAEQELADAKRIAGDMSLVRERFGRSATGRFVTNDVAQQMANNLVIEKQGALERVRIEEQTAARVASVRQTIYRVVATENGRIALADRNRARERLAIATQEEARLLEVYRAGQFAIMQQFGRATAADVAEGGALSGALTRRGTPVVPGQLLSVEQATTKANAALAATRAEIAALDAQQAAALPRWGGLWNKQRELLANNATAARSLGYGLLGAGAVMGFIFLEPIKQAAILEKQVRNVISISTDLQKTNEGLQQQYFLTYSQALHGVDQYGQHVKGILELSQELPQSNVELAKGLYEIASAGKFGADGLRLLQVSAMAASAGLTDTQNAATAIISVLNAYGMSTAQAGHVSDILFQTVRVGIVTFEELTQQIGDFVAFGAAAHIPIDQLGISLAAITRAGVPAAEASTSLNRVIQAFVKPSKDMQSELKSLGLAQDATALSTKLTTEQASRFNIMLDQSGRDHIPVLAGQALGLTGIMQVLGAATGGNVTQLQHLFREIRAGRGAYALTAAQGHVLVQTIRDFGDANQQAGSTLRALQEQQKGVAYQWAVTRNVFNTLGVEMAQGFLPIVRGVVLGVQDIGKAFTSLPGWIKTGMEGFGLVLTTALLFFGVVNVLGGRVAALGRALVSLGFSAQVAGTAMRVASIGANILGIVITVGALLLARHAKAQQEAAAAAQAHKDALEQEAAGVAGVSEAYYTQQLSASKALAALNDLHINAAVALNAIRGSADAQNQLRDSLASIAHIDVGSHNYVELEKALRGDKDASQSLINGPGGLKDMAANASGDTKKKIEDFIAVIGTINPLTRQRAQDLKAIALEQAASNASQKALNGSISLGAVDLNKFGGAIKNVKDGVVQLNDDQKELQKTLIAMVDPTATYDTILSHLAPLTTATQVYVDAQNAASKQATANAKASAKAYNQSLSDQSYAQRVSARNEKQAITERLSQYQKVSAGTRAAATSEKNAITDRTDAIVHANQRAKKSADDFKKTARVALGDYINDLDLAVARQQDYQRNIDTLFSKAVRLHIDTSFIEEIRASGKDGVQLAAELADGTDTQLRRVSADYRKLKPDVSKSLSEFIQEMQEQANAFNAFQSNLEKIAGRGYDTLAVKIAGMGPKAGAALAAAAAKGTDQQLSHLGDIFDAAGQYTGNSLGAGMVLSFQKQLSLMKALAATSGNDLKLKDIATQLDLPGGTQDIINFFQTYRGQIKNLPKDVQLKVNIVLQAQDILDQHGKKVASAEGVAAKEIDKIRKRKDLPVAVRMSMIADVKEGEATAVGKLQASYDRAKKTLDKYAAGDPVVAPIKVKGDPKDVDKALRLNQTRTVKVRVLNDDNTIVWVPVKAGAPLPRGALAPDQTIPGARDTTIPHLPTGARLSPAIGAIINYYARGGIREDHIAQIAPAGSMRVWAEPETGGEAYIPLAASKRMRSGAILEDVASRFGYKLMKFVDGGFSGGQSRPVGSSWGYGGGQPVIHVHVETKQGPTHIDNGVDIKHLEMRPLDFNDAIRQTQRRRRRAAIAGGVTLGV